MKVIMFFFFFFENVFPMSRSNTFLFYVKLERTNPSSKALGGSQDICQRRVADDFNE